LFKGYEAVPDPVFKDYIKQKKSAYEEGGTINPKELMQLAQNNFEGCVLAKTWNAPTNEQEQIIALEARIERLQEQKRNLSKRKPQGSRNAQQKTLNLQHKKKSNQNKKKDDCDNEYMNATGKWAWLKVPPKQNETKKMFKGKEFFWCKKNTCWGHHATSKCRLTTTKSENKNSGSSKNNSQQDPKLRFTESLKAILEGQDEDEEE
jgi:YHS domain-containing protein